MSLPFEYIGADLDRFWIYIVVAIIWGVSSWLESKRKEKIKAEAERRRRESVNVPQVEDVPLPSPAEVSVPDEVVLTEKALREMGILPEEETDIEQEDHTVRTEHELDSREHELTEAATPPENLSIAMGRLQKWTPVEETPITSPPQKPLPFDLFPAGARQALIAAEILSKPKALRRQSHGR